MSVRTSRLRRGSTGEGLSWSEAVRRRSQVAEIESDEEIVTPRQLKLNSEMPAYRNYLQERRKSMRGTLDMMGGGSGSHSNSRSLRAAGTQTLAGSVTGEDQINPLMYDFNKSMQQMWEAGARQGHRGSLTGRMLDIANKAPRGPPALTRRRGHVVAPLERPLPVRGNSLHSINEDQETSVTSDNLEEENILLPRHTHHSVPSAKIGAIANFRRKLSLKEVQGKLRRLVRFVILLLRTWRHHSMRTEDVLNKMDAMEMLVDKKDRLNSDLLFDLSIYKAHREAPISMEARRILMKEPGTRTEPELHYVQVALRNYRSIAEYPVRIQRLLTERCFYQKYRAKRVIIREGYLASHFYFLLSGSVVVSLLDVVKGVNKTLYFLSRGDSFGELALVNQARREITVVSKESVELLVLTAEDFTNIFLSGGIDEPFLRSLPFLEGWPLDRMEKNTKKVIFSFFKRDAILTNDSRKSEWIYIVKSGSCRLLKRLKPEENGHRRKKKELSSTLSFDEDHEEELTRLYREELDRAKASGKLASMGQLGLNIAANHVTNRPKYTEAQTSEARPDSTEKPRQPPSVPVSRQTSFVLGSSMKGPFLAATPSISRAPSQLPLVENNKINVKEVDGAGDRSEGDLYDKGYEGQGPGRVTWDNSDEEGRKEGAVQKRKGGAELFQTPSCRARTIRADSASRFVVVQVLTKGNVFGLADVMCGDQPSFSMVSNGAEVIMIQKRFYLENAPQSLINKLRNEVYPYPTDKELQRSLRQHLNWDTERRATLLGTVNKLRVAKMDIHDARTRLSAL